MTYTLQIQRRAQKELAQVPSPAYEKVLEHIRALAGNPRPKGSKKLAGRHGWRIRAGTYRIIYEADGERKTVTILHVGHRRDVYKQ